MSRYTPTMIFLLFCLFLIFSNWNCASTNSLTGEEETHYPLLDTSFELHTYEDNVQWVLFVKNKKRTEYCSVHFEWEDITPVYRNINEEYKWVYQVKKNKKGFK